MTPTFGNNASLDRRLEQLVLLETSLGKLVRTVHETVSADMAMLSYLDADSHHVLVPSGFELPPEHGRRVPLEYSICQHTVAMDYPLVVDNALDHPLLKNNVTVSAFGVAAYLGAPIHIGGTCVGTICAMQLKPRRWSADTIACLIKAAKQIDELLTSREREDE